MALQAVGTVEDVTRNAAVLPIHLVLGMFVAGHAGEHLAVVRVGVARRAIVPFPFVFPGEDGEKLCIVFSETVFLATWMAREARLTFVKIPRHAIVLVVHFLLAVFMACQTGKHALVGRVGVADGAIVPFALVLSGKNREK